MTTDGFFSVEDVLYPSNNTFEIPTLRSDRQAGLLTVPLAAYGSGRSMAKALTVHFYVDDYRFENLWKYNPQNEAFAENKTKRSES